MFSWTVRFTFAIIFVDLRQQGYHTSDNDNLALMNTMCDMSQCVIIVSFPDVFMKFGLCRVV